MTGLKPFSVLATAATAAGLDPGIRKEWPFTGKWFLAPLKPFLLRFSQSIHQLKQRAVRVFAKQCGSEAVFIRNAQTGLRKCDMQATRRNES